MSINHSDLSGAVIGASMKIAGGIVGEEDLTINGDIDGGVQVRGHSVRVGESGRVKSNITAKTIVVAGHVTGDLHAEEQVTITASGRVIGDIQAPRVSLDDGCQFKGAVDMEAKTNGADRGHAARFIGNGKSAFANRGQGVLLSPGRAELRKL